MFLEMRRMILFFRSLVDSLCIRGVAMVSKMPIEKRQLRAPGKYSKMTDRCSRHHGRKKLLPSRTHTTEALLECPPITSSYEGKESSSLGARYGYTMTGNSFFIATVDPAA